MIALHADPDHGGADGGQCRRDDREPVVVPVYPVRSDGETGEQDGARQQREREDRIAENFEAVIEAAELQGSPAVVVDLGLHFLVCDRGRQVRKPRGVDAPGGTAYRLPGARRVPFDPALGHRVRGRPRRVWSRHGEHLQAAHRPQAFGHLPIV